MRSHPLLRQLLLYVLLLCLTAMPAAAQVSDGTPWNHSGTPLRQCLSKLQRFLGVPGMTLVMKDVNLAVGNRSLVPRVPLTPDDPYRIGSVTKAFTATVILILIKEGKLSLDTKLTDVLGAERVAMIPNANQVTVRMLLQMTSGIAEYNTPAFRDELFDDPARDWTPDQILASLPATGTAPFFAPNSSCAECPGYCYSGNPCWKYANTNFVLLGMIAEEVTHMPIEELYRDMVLRPLKMRRTYMATTREIRGVHARGYMTKTPPADCPSVPGYDLYDVTECFEPDAAWSAGAIISDSDDLKLFLDELASGSLIGPELQALRMQPITGLHGGFPIGYGLGVMIVTLDAQLPPIVGHAGEFFGYGNLAFYMDLDQDKVPDQYIISMINGTGGPVDFKLDLLALAISQTFGQLQCPIQ